MRSQGRGQGGGDGGAPRSNVAPERVVTGSEQGPDNETVTPPCPASVRVGKTTTYKPLGPRVTIRTTGHSEPIRPVCHAAGVQRRHSVTFSSISVTRAAIGERSERVSVTWANSGCPLSFSTTATTPSC